MPATEYGSTTEISIVGHKGVIGISALLKANKSPYRAMVQIPGKAFRIRADMLIAESSRGGELQNLLLRYLHAQITEISQSAVCNRFHTIEERLCRWLLISQDHVGAGAICLTQEALAQMVGASRTNVTVASNSLKQAGLIAYHRGKIRIIDRPGLEATVCECYRVTERES